MTRAVRLPVDEEFRPLAIPVVLAEETMPAEPSGTLHAIQVVQQPGAASGICADGEVPFQPSQASLQRFVGLVLGAAVGGSVGVEVFVVPEHRRGDDQRRDPGDRHAPGAFLIVRSAVAPSPVGVLVPHPVLMGALPRPAADGNSRIGRVAQTENRKLPVTAVPAGVHQAFGGAVTPRSRVLASYDLRIFQFLGEREDAGLVSLAVLGGGHRHNHQRDLVGQLRIGFPCLGSVAQVVESLPHRLVAGGHARVDQGQQRQAANADFVAASLGARQR